MKALIIHDSIMMLDKEGNYYNRSIDKEHYKRYFSIADEVKVIMRTKRLRNEPKNNINLIDLPNFEVISCPEIMSFKGILFNKNKAKRLIKKEIIKSDFLVLKTPGFFANIAVKYANEFNKPYITEIGGCPWDSLWNHSWKGKIVAPYQYLKTKQIIKNSSHVIYVTNDFLQKRYPSNGKTVNCSNVELEKINENVLSKRLTKINEIKKKNELIIGTTAAIDVKYKGQQFVIKALSKLKKSGIENFKYQLVGGGDNSYLKSIAEKNGVLDKIDFLGRKNHLQVFNWLEKIDLYIQPSTTEGLPRALIEAMSKALPSFGSNAGGIPELLEDQCIFTKGDNGVIEIHNILSSINKDDMKKQAKRNYNESKKYKKSVIKKRRDEFLNMFINDIKKDNI